MEQPKIYISEHYSQQPKECKFFEIKKYFSELKTDVEKARARYNLGIPDEFSLTWEAIVGKPDINQLLNQQKASIVSTYHLDTLSYDLNLIRSNILELQNVTAGLTPSKILEVDKLWSDVARNSRDILALQTGGDTSVMERLEEVENLLGEEQSTRATEDTTLSNRITAEASRAQAAETALQTSITSFLSGAVFMGFISKNGSPANGTQNMFYLASETGTYTNFGNLTVSVLPSILYKINSASWAIRSISPAQIFTGTTNSSVILNNINNSVVAENATAEGLFTQANNNAEHAEGKYNLSNLNTIHSIGIGTSENDRKNAFQIMNSGKVYVYGLGGYTGKNADQIGVESLQDIIDTVYPYATIQDIKLTNNQTYTQQTLLENRGITYSLLNGSDITLTRNTTVQAVLVWYDTENLKVSNVPFIQNGTNIHFTTQDYGYTVIKIIVKFSNGTDCSLDFLP